MTEFHFVFSQLFQQCVPRNISSFETKTLKLSTTLSCHATWLAFLVQPVHCSWCADSKPNARALGWQNTCLARDSDRIAPYIHAIVGSGRTIVRVTSSLIISSFKNRCIEMCYKILNYHRYLYLLSTVINQTTFNTRGLSLFSSKLPAT